MLYHITLKSIPTTVKEFNLRTKSIARIEIQTDKW